MKNNQVILLLFVVTIMLGCDPIEEIPKCIDTPYSFGEDTEFTTQEVDSTFNSIDSLLLVDTLIFPIDTLSLFDSLFVSHPDTLFLVDLDSDPWVYDTTLLNGIQSELLDSVSLTQPDSIFLFAKDLVEVLSSVDTSTVTQNITEYTNAICLDNVEEQTVKALAEAESFAQYIIGNWDVDEVFKCEDLEDISSSYTLFTIRFDVANFSTTTLTLKYFTTFAQPIFNATGTITISLTEDFTGDVVTGQRSDGKSVEFQDLNDNLNTNNLSLDILDVFECGSGEGRILRLGNARLRCRRF
ncbi:MAG: hypothetical protein ABJH72_18150 [Reichenbachiella sp.]|uniref:hypothetical protein n=1 Tax=Reichenbachiella sp. TaxID=2184521 RepID=UPI0032992C2E